MKNARHVRDARNHNIRGLWEVNGRYYAQLRYPGKQSASTVALVGEDQQPVRTAAEAVAAMHRLREQRNQGQQAPSPRITPQFDQYVEHYLKRLTDLQAKASSTIATYGYLLRAWSFGTLRLNQITRKMILDAMARRKQEDKVSNKTVNEELQALRGLFNFAVTEGYARKEHLPTSGIAKLPYRAPRKKLLEAAEIEAFCAEATRPGELAEPPEMQLLRRAIAEYRGPNGRVQWRQALAEHPEWKDPLAAHQGVGHLHVRAHHLAHRPPVPAYRHGVMLADWVRFMAYTGARNSAARRAQWEHIVWKLRHLHLFTKRSTEVIVPFHPKLEALLLDMQRRRVPDASGALSPFLFPSPRSAAKASPISSFAKTLGVIRTRLGLPHFTPHNLRHYFASVAVMSGIDFMTIARVMGHKDGGILVAKTYGHLRPTHVEEAIKKLNFGEAPPAPTPPPEPPQLRQMQAQMDQLMKMVAQLGAATPPSPG